MANNYTTTSLEALKYLCSVINKTVDLPNTVISDTSIATNTTYSSFRLDKEFDTLEDELKHYTDTAIAGLNKLTKEIINDKSLVVKDNVLYLYKADDDASNNYMQMMMINGVAVELGSTQVDMSDYYSKTDSDNKFATKLDLTTITTSLNDLKTVIGDTTQIKNNTLMEDMQELYTGLDDRVSKTDVVTTLSDTVTDEQVSSALLTKTELDKKADTDKVVKKIYIRDTSLEDARIIIQNHWSEFDNFEFYTARITTGKWTWNAEIYAHSKDYGTVLLRSYGSDVPSVFYGRLYQGGWTWQKLCSTKVEDVGRTFVPFTPPDNMTVYNTDRPELFGLYYIVKNGVCYVDVTMSIITVGELNGFVSICKGLPKPAISYVRNEVNSWNDKTAPTLGLAINGDSNELLLSAYNMSSPTLTASNPQSYFGYFKSFSYPVIES